MTQLYRIKLCCKPLVMIMICSSELDWVMIEVWNYMCDFNYASIFMFIYLHVIRLYWNWHTCIPYALDHPRIIGVSA